MTQMTYIDTATGDIGSLVTAISPSTTSLPVSSDPTSQLVKQLLGV